VSASEASRQIERAVVGSLDEVKGKKEREEDG
jgi:hypothetical protein